MAAMVDDEAPTPRPWIPDPPVTAGGPRSRAREERPDSAYGRPWQPVAGPADRVSFFEEQARHRRATWRLAAASTLAVVLAGLPLSLVVTPGVFLLIILLTKVATFVMPVPPTVPQFYRSVAMAIGSIVEAMDKWPPPPALLGSAIAGAFALVVPGILTMLVLWIMLRQLFSGAGVGALLIGLGAREPRLNDLEEHQLVNVVEEMAIAAGLPAPRVMLVDAEIANAATVGSSPDDAVVIVSRRLLDELDRDETQGVLGHLIASIGNGDLGIALMMVTVFRTFGLVNTLLDAPISSSARATLWQLLTVVAGSGRGDDAVRAARVAELLGSRVEQMEMEDVDLVLGDDAQKARAPRGIMGLLLKVRVYAMFPIWAASGMAKTALMLMVFSFLSPLLSWTWRTRRYLADATAVQLTRNPDGIARGLEALLSRGGGITGGEWADHLFIVGGGQARSRRFERRREAMRARIERDTAGKTGANRLFAAIGSQYQAGQENRAEILADAEEEPRPASTGGLQSWLSPHPSLQRRQKRLQAQGAHVDAASFGRPGPTPKQILLMVAIFGPIGALCAVLLGIAVVLATGLTIVFMMIPLAVVYGIFGLLF